MKGALRPRIVLVMLFDALRYPSLAYALREFPQLLPGFRFLRSRGVFFEQCLSLTNTTVPSITSMLTGRHPLETRVLNQPPQISRHELRRIGALKPVTAALRRLGYSSMYVGVFTELSPMFDTCINPGRGGPALKLFLSEVESLRLDCIEALSIGAKIVRRLGRAAGLGEVLDLPPRDPLAHTLLALSIVKRFAEAHRRLFLFLHLLPTHTPYYVIERVRRLVARRLEASAPPELMKSVDELLLESVRGGRWLRRLWLIARFQRLRRVVDIVSAYTSSIVAADQCVKAVLEFLESSGLMDQTLLTVLADHGESLYEHGIVMDHHGLYSTTTRVPLAMLFEGDGIEHEVRRDPATLMDVAPTIASVAGARLECSGIDLSACEAPENRVIEMIECFVQCRTAIVWRGLRLLKAPRGPRAVCRYCLRIHGGGVELYDTSRDPDERVNVFDPGVEEHRRLLERAARVEARLRVALGVAQALSKRTG